jgi:hypothetical protein
MRHSGWRRSRGVAPGFRRVFAVRGIHQVARGKINLEREAEVWRATLASIEPQAALVFGLAEWIAYVGEFDFGCKETTAI